MSTGGRVMLDTNLWSSIGDDHASQRFDVFVQARALEVLTPPSTLMEVCRHPVPEVRQRIISALARYPRGRLPTEAQLESAEVVAEARRSRPQWLRSMPDTAKVASLNAFWTKRVWRIAQQDAQGIHDYEATNAQPLIASEMLRQKHNRTSLLRGKFNLRPLTALMEKATPERAATRAPGWSGEPVEAWRTNSREIFWHALVSTTDRSPFTGEDRTFADWVGAYLDLPTIRSDPADFTRFWLEDVQIEAVRRQWVRWAVQMMQNDRKVTPGNPADRQHSSYLVDCDLFLSADAALISVLEIVGEDAPFPFAKPVLVSGDRSVPIMDRLAAAL